MSAREKLRNFGGTSSTDCVFSLSIASSSKLFLATVSHLFPFFKMIERRRVYFLALIAAQTIESEIENEGNGNIPNVFNVKYSMKYSDFLHELSEW